jgi:2-C-methyl-D-erythritol 4-phosphate cytidylyltransferase
VNVYAVILAGGVGLRFGAGASDEAGENAGVANVPKQLQMLDDCSVLAQTVRAFTACAQVDYAVVVMNTQWIEEAKTSLESIPRGKILGVIEGGATRWASSFLGVQFVQNHAQAEAKVLIHDAVRPHISSAQIELSVQTLRQFDAVVPVVPITESIIEVNASPGDKTDAFAYRARENFRVVQTPQGFSLNAISTAYQRFSEAFDGFEPTDDMSVLRRYSPDVRVKLIDGDIKNKKITYPSDLR